MATTQLPAVLQALNELSIRIMTPREIQDLQIHILEGAPGFQRYLQSKRGEKMARMMIDDYIEFQKTGQ